MGLTIVDGSRSLAATSCSIGVKRKKLSSLTSVTSRESSFARILSNSSAAYIPPKPPPRIRTRSGRFSMVSPFGPRAARSASGSALLANLGRGGRRLAGQRCRREVDAETVAPDRDGVILRQVEVGRDVVVLVADVPLHGAERDEPGLRDRFVVIRVAGRAEIYLHLRTVGGREVGQPQHALAVGEPVDRRDPLRLVRGAMKVAARERDRRSLCRGLLHGRKLLVDLLVDEQTLGPEGVPTDRYDDQSCQ